MVAGPESSVKHVSFQWHLQLAFLLLPLSFVSRFRHIQLSSPLHK